MVYSYRRKHRKVHETYKKFAKQLFLPQGFSCVYYLEYYIDLRPGTSCNWHLTLAIELDVMCLIMCVETRRKGLCMHFTREVLILYAAFM